MHRSKRAQTASHFKGFYREADDDELEDEEPDELRMDSGSRLRSSSRSSRSSRRHSPDRSTDRSGSRNRKNTEESLQAGYASGESSDRRLRLRKRTASSPLQADEEEEEDEEEVDNEEEEHEAKDTPLRKRSRLSTEASRSLASPARLQRRQQHEDTDSEGSDSGSKKGAAAEATGSPPFRLTRSRSREQVKHEDDEDEDGDGDGDDDEDEDEDDKKKYGLRQRKPVNYVPVLPPLSPEKPLRGGRNHKGSSNRDVVRALFGRGSYSGSRFASQPERPRSGAHDASDSDDDDTAARRKGSRQQPSGLLIDNVTAAPADIDPVVSGGVDFDAVGGLDHHVNSLKEMVLLPLLYPEIYERFNIAPPRGVLFHGPPGTGKTLVARALASACSKTTGQKISFFMRKGADCLSKWVGEAERQLRLLFDQALAVQPAIIFFDEIDGGLAPVRSAKQEQIYSSIVSTLLALMDGLTSRGQVVVIGATNRIDAIDPALRRPGRFDREFLFPLPDQVARRKIIEIHTKTWQPPLAESVMDELATKTKGFCGADLRSLCTEAALNAVRRYYPEIYSSDDRLLVDPDSIELNPSDFRHAFKVVVPTAQRSAPVAAGEPLPRKLAPLLEKVVNTCLDRVKEQLGVGAHESFSASTFVSSIANANDDHGDHVKRSVTVQVHLSYVFVLEPAVFRPRLVICGESSAAVGAAVINMLAPMPVQALDMATLMQDATRTPETALFTLVREASARTPAVFYIPSLDQWWFAASTSLQEAFLVAVKSLPPLRPILVLASCDVAYERLPAECRAIFDSHTAHFALQMPTQLERQAFWQQAFDYLDRPPAGYEVDGEGCLTQVRTTTFRKLPKAPPRPPPEPTPQQKALQDQRDRDNLVRLRLDLRFIAEELFKIRKFHPFSRPVDFAMTEYYEEIEHPMDLSTILEKINEGMYFEANDFLDDIDLMTRNCRQFHLSRVDENRLVSRAYDIADYARVRVADMDPVLLKDCADSASRLRPVAAPASGGVPNGTGVSRASLRLRGISLDVDLSKDPPDTVRQKSLHHSTLELSASSNKETVVDDDLNGEEHSSNETVAVQDTFAPGPLHGLNFVQGNVTALVDALVKGTSNFGIEKLLALDVELQRKFYDEAKHLADRRPLVQTITSFALQL